MLSRKLFRIGLIALVSGVSFFAAIYVVGTDTIVSTLGNIGGRAALLAGLLILLNTALVFFRFRSVLGSFGYTPPWRDALLAFTVGQVSNQVLLNIVGQSLSRAAALKAAQIPVGVSVLATYWERVIAAGLLFLFSLGGAFFLFLRIGIDLESGGTYLLSLLAGVVLVFAVNFALLLTRPAVRGQIRQLPRQLLRFWPALLLTLAAQACMLLAYLVLLADYNQPVSPGVVAALTIVMFTASLPISFSGWGIRELSAAQALAVVGVSSSTAVAGAVAIGLLSLLVTLAGGILGAWLFAQARLASATTARPAAEAETPINHDHWLGIVAGGAVFLSAILVYFQIRLPTANAEVTANAADILALTGLGMLLLLAWLHRSFRPLPAFLIWALGAISLLLLFSLGVGYLRFGSNDWALMNRGFGWVVITGYVALGALMALTPRNTINAMLQAFTLSGATIAALQLVLMLYALFIDTLPADMLSMPLRGYAGNSNAFAFQMVMAAAATIALRHAVSFRMPQYLSNAALLVILAAIHYSHSRAGMGMMAILIIVMMVFSPPERRRQAFVTAGYLCGAYLLLLLLPSILAYAQTLLTSFDLNRSVSAYLSLPLRRDSSDSERWLTIVQGWDLWLQHPVLGNGLGAYVQGRIEAGQQFLVIHSVPVWLLAETGLLGLLVLTVVLILFVKTAFEAMARPQTLAWGLGLLIILACMTASGLVHDFFFQRPFWFLLGLFIAAAVRQDDGEAGAIKS